MKRLFALLLAVLFALSGCTAVMVTEESGITKSEISVISKALETESEASEISDESYIAQSSQTEDDTNDTSKTEENQAESLPETDNEESKADESQAEESKSDESQPQTETSKGIGDKDFRVDLSAIPQYTSSPYYALNGNIPYFAAEDITTQSFEYYSDLDYLERCGVTLACIGVDIMPTEERGSIGSVKPTGWHTVKYDNVDGKYLYNRCHLIGFQLTGENANVRNLITGTRYMNVEGMLPFENMVADYVKETGNHVMFRVTPIFEGENLLASGVQMEAYSVEDEGDGICFNVFCYNVQPDIAIDYATGDSEYAPYYMGGEDFWEDSENSDSNSITYVLNTNTKKFHHPNCSSADKISEENREEVNSTRDELIMLGYDPCGNCKP